MLGQSPELCSSRSVQILLNYLPLERASWTSILAKQRELYSQFLREMIIQPGIAKANMGVSREDVTFEDHVSWGQQRGQRLQSGQGCGLWSG